MVRSSVRRNISRIVLAFAALLLVFAGAMSVALVAFAQRAISHIDVDPAAFAVAWKNVLVSTLKDGKPEEKLEVMRLLRDMGADAQEFVPALTAALGDDDARVRAAAAEVLRKIDHGASE